ncbi:OLD family protein [Dickeya dadantii]|uniref:hypothetical protein n=1 Tax=Dickeya dadantii TaxID=204038 RepID=UPI001CC81E1F|nr:hypothetical protein [Dickeya dadantii]UAY95119.1 hypothetical protein KTF62_14885 [Dickeya dadantii]
MSQQLIKSIFIKNLFGLYTYNIGKKELFDDAVILYGDNGVGKSTILRLVFHLLSWDKQSGHRTALYKTNFEYLEVVLASGIKLTCQVYIDSDSRKKLNLKITESNIDIAIWDYSGRDQNSRHLIMDMDGDAYHIYDDEDLFRIKELSKKEVILKEKKLQEKDIISVN